MEHVSIVCVAENGKNILYVWYGRKGGGQKGENMENSPTLSICLLKILSPIIFENFLALPCAFRQPAFSHLFIGPSQGERGQNV